MAGRHHKADSMKSSCRRARRLQGAAGGLGKLMTGRRVINYLTTSIVLVSLFAFAIAASSLPQRRQLAVGPQQSDSESDQLDDALTREWQALARLVRNGGDEAKAVVRQFFQEEAQIKQPRNQQVLDRVERQLDTSGLLEPSQLQVPRVQSYQEPAYLLVDAQPSASNLGDNFEIGGGRVEADVVAVPPSGGYDLAGDEEAYLQNERQLTLDNYQLLESLLLDKTTPDGGSDEQELANVKRQEDQHPKTADQHKYTTLLEDEQPKANETQAAPVQDESAATTVTYGKLVYDQAPGEQDQARPVAAGQKAPIGLFNRMYANLVHYLPFLNQVSILREGASPKASAAGANSASEFHAKQSVSVTRAQNKSAATLMADHSGQSEGDKDNHQQEPIDHEVRVAGVKPEDEQQHDKSEDDVDNTVHVLPVKITSGPLEVDDSQEDQEADQLRARKSSNSKRLGGSLQLDDGQDLDTDMSQMVPFAPATGNLASESQAYESQARQQINNYNLLRQSSLALPLASAQDEALARASLRKEPSDSLLGKYIYAPTIQHYYPASSSSGGPVLSQDHHHHQPFASLAGKRLQLGDEIYGSYGGVRNVAGDLDGPLKMATAYAAYQKDPTSSIANKSNDLYFLIMVGAFCMMAMAVVLAAGMFAYRVQQQRKSSQDQDYPTYGVVGPNNMSIGGAGPKCDAAAFVGGYFAGPSGGSSKSGSVKHLPDLFYHHQSHHGASAGGSDSGLNSLDKSSSAKKASSASSLSEHNHQSSHISSVTRTAPNNFMVTASQDAARMYHYQHQKQQMIISDRTSGGRHTSASDMDSEDDNDDGSYTVYECPGLASAHEMEIKNPLFNDDQSP